jgi:hypothetical protein
MSEHSFLNLEFTPVGPDQDETLRKFLRDHPQPLSGYTFAMLATWAPTYRYEWVRIAPETILISCVPYPDTQRHLLQPVGPVSQEVRQKIIEGARTTPYPLKLVNVSGRFIKTSPEFLESFSFRENRAFSNYVYRADALARLRGRKYSKKRNLLSQASKLYEWTCKPLSQDETGACFDVLDAIQTEEQPLIEGMLEREIAALKFALTHFKELGQEGLVLFVDGAPVAFSIFEEISPSMVAVHFERALRRFKGLYQVINYETSKLIFEKGYEFINREEDLGDEGLRDAKKSYHPIKVVPAFELSYLS